MGARGGEDGIGKFAHFPCWKRLVLAWNYTNRAPDLPGLARRMGTLSVHPLFVSHWASFLACFGLWRWEERAVHLVS